MDPLSVIISVVQLLQFAGPVVSSLRALATEYNTYEDHLEQLESTVEVLKEENNKIRSNIKRATDLGIEYRPAGSQTQQHRAYQRIQSVSEKLRQERESVRGRFSKARSVLWNGPELREMEKELNNFRVKLQEYRQGFLELSYSF
jgi:chromosome segregation ATPase